MALLKTLYRALLCNKYSIGWGNKMDWNESNQCNDWLNRTELGQNEDKK